MAKEPPTLHTIERRVETLEAGMDSANALLKDLVEQLGKFNKKVEELNKKLDETKAVSTPRPRKTKSTQSDQ
jgi:F0F1-type ATP synthase membrane subunit b/b'